MDSPEAFGPHKCKLSTKVTTNGDPEVEQKRKKLEAKKQSMKAAPTQKHSSTGPPAKTKTMTKAAAKPTPQQQCPSVEIKEIEDKVNYCASVPPRNPQHILEAADGSDDDVDTTAPPQKSTTSTKKPVNTKRCPSIEIEEIDDDSDYCTSVPPRNPQHILEAANGSDNNDKEDSVPGESEQPLFYPNGLPFFKTLNLPSA
jgi:hypothetical protein